MSRYRFLLLALILVLALVWLAARSLPPGLDAPTLFNLIEYQAVRHLNLGHADSTHTGAVSGTVWDTTGNPVADAVVIVSTARGQATWGWTDAAGRYHLDMVPAAGWYVPAAGKVGYPEATGCAFVLWERQEIGRQDITLSPLPPSPIAANASLRLSEATIASTPPPVAAQALRRPFSFENDGLQVEGFLYTPVSDADPSRPILLVVFPGPAGAWDLISVPLAADGYVVVALGMSAERGLDIDGYARDVRKALALTRAGRFGGDPTRIGVLAGSLSSTWVLQALRQTEAVQALVILGGVSDAVLMVQALYADQVYLDAALNMDLAVAGLGSPQRRPDFFLRYSPAFYAGALPPVLILHGHSDETVPVGQATRLAAELSRLGKPHELRLYTGQAHYPGVENPTETTLGMWAQALRFLAAHLKEVGSRQ